VPSDLAAGVGLRQQDTTFLCTDGAPHTRGYVCCMAATMRGEDNPENVKLRLKQNFVEQKTLREPEMQCLHYCSRRYEMYITFATDERDPYAAFLEPAVPYPSVDSLRARAGGLSQIENELHELLTKRPAEATIARDRIRTNLVLAVYGLAPHPLRDALEKLRGSCDPARLLEYTRVAISGAVAKHLHVCADTPMPQLRHAALFALDLARFDCSERVNAPQQHAEVHAAACAGTVNDDAQAALREAQHYRAFRSGLNVVNFAVLRWLLASHVSLWSSTLSGCYGYCVQICDMGNSVRVCMKKGTNFPGDADRMVEWDKKKPGSGADTIWNMFGECVNAFPKFAGRSAAIRAFAQGKNFCKLYQHMTPMAFKRKNCVVLNTHGLVMAGMSEHDENMGVVGAMLELNKIEKTQDAKAAVWPNLEMGLGQSGSSNDGVDEVPYQTTLSQVPVNLHRLTPLQILLLASNLLSVDRPASTNDGSRVVPVTAGCDDECGCIAERPAQPAHAPPAQSSCARLGSFTHDLRETPSVRKVDASAVARSQSMFLMEYLARVFALVHRGLCLPRSVSSGCDMFVWGRTRDYTLHLTTNLRKATYTSDDIMERNFNGALETLLFGKAVRSVLQTALHRRLLQTAHAGSARAETHLQHVLCDAIATFVLVPAPAAVLLSAMHLYLTLAVLDVGTMLVSCMVLYYAGLQRGCPLDVLALVVRGASAFCFLSVVFFVCCLLSLAH